MISLFATSCFQDAEKREGNLILATSLPVFGSIISELTLPNDEIVVLLNNNQSPHEYQPRPSDVRRFSNAEIVFLGHPDLDGWAGRLSDVSPLFLAATNSDPHVNPHFWFDPMEVQKSAGIITTSLCASRPLLCPDYEELLDIFEIQLAVLDTKIVHVIDPLAGESVVTSHPFFDYFLTRYNITSVATLESSPDHEASPSSVIEVLDQIKTHSPIGVIAQQHESSGILQIIKDETELPVVFIEAIGNSEQSYEAFMMSAAASIISLRRN